MHQPVMHEVLETLLMFPGMNEVPDKPVDNPEDRVRRRGGRAM